MRKDKPNEANLEGIQKPAEYLKFIEFMSLPRVIRKREFGIELLQEFAKKYDLEPSTLSRWQNRKDFWSAVRKEMKGWAKNKTPNVILALYNKAIRDGNAKEAKLWFQYIEDWAEKHGVDLGIGDDVDSIEFKVTRKKDEAKNKSNNSDGQERDRIPERDENSDQRRGDGK